MVTRSTEPSRRFDRWRGRYWYVRHVWTDLRGLLRLVRSWRELESALRYCVLRLVRRHGVTSLHVRGVTHLLLLSSWESFPILEIYGRRCYAQVAGFEPHRGWTVVDVGANIGAYSLRQASRGAHVYAVEPNPDCYDRLLRAVAINDLSDRVTALQCAIGSSGGFVQMRVTRDQTQLGTIERTDAAADAIPITSLDELMVTLGLDHVDLLKVDVEGHEAEMLRGATVALAKVDRVVMEYHSEALQQDACTVLRRHGFAVTCVDSAGGHGELYAISTTLSAGSLPHD